MVRCFPLHIERVIDNLLNNASNAFLKKEENFLFGAIVRTHGRGGDQEYGSDLRRRKRSIYSWRRQREGLHISTRLIKNMKGVMSVESREGQTTFSVMLPLIEPKDAEDH